MLATLLVTGEPRTRLAGAGDGLVLGGEEVDGVIHLATERLAQSGFDESYQPTHSALHSRD